MPLTQSQLDAISLLLDGDPEDENVLFVEKLITDFLEIINVIILR